MSLPPQLDFGPNPPPAPAAPPVRDPNVAPVWLQRLSLFILVIFCVYVGVAMAVMPWLKRVWDENGLILGHPLLAHYLHMGAVRGLISGIGLVDIWIGISEAIHYRDYRG